MKTLKNTILLLCQNEDCRRMYLARREDYEKGPLTSKAVFVTGVCDRCQEPGNFYGEEQEYYGEEGLIPWFEEEVK